MMYFFPFSMLKAIIDGLSFALTWTVQVQQTIWSENTIPYNPYTRMARPIIVNGVFSWQGCLCSLTLLSNQLGCVGLFTASYHQYHRCTFYARPWKQLKVKQSFTVFILFGVKVQRQNLIWRFAVVLRRLMPVCRSNTFVCISSTLRCWLRTYVDHHHSTISKKKILHSRTKQTTCILHHTLVYRSGKSHLE